MSNYFMLHRCSLSKSHGIEIAHVCDTWYTSRCSMWNVWVLTVCTTSLSAIQKKKRTWSHWRIRLSTNTPYLLLFLLRSLRVSLLRRSNWKKREKEKKERSNNSRWNFFFHKRGALYRVPVFHWLINLSLISVSSFFLPANVNYP